MRLFVAVNFDSATVNRILDIIAGMRPYANAGYFTRKENLHLTLAFIGEVQAGDAARIAAALGQVSAPRFELEFKELGSFGRGGGRLYWLGFEHSPELIELSAGVRRALDALSPPVEYDRKQFKPHITLGRELTMDKTDFSIIRHSFPVNRFQLVKSEQIQGRRVYTELSSFELQSV